MNSWKQIKRGVERRLLTALYSIGNRVTCCYCGWAGFRFLPAGDNRIPNRLCPRCGSLQRYRQLCLYLKEQGFEDPTRPVHLLEIAPKPCMRNYCQQFSHVTYVGSDLDSPQAQVFSDLTQMGMASAVFDIIVCFHVLEHIPDDRTAIREIRRLLKPNGYALIMVPINGDNTFEDPMIPPERFEEVFGQSDHVRICGMDYHQRMIENGLQVETIDMVTYFSPETMRRFALYGKDRYLFRVNP